MKKLPTCSLLISTYNWPEALAVCLNSIVKQTIKPNEIVIADDGSTSETKELIEKFKLTSTIPVKHIWHPDEGFKLAQIRNKAIANCSFNYIIQVDGDLFLDKNFVKDHLIFAKKNSFVRASRIYMNANLSELFLSGKKETIKMWDKGLANKFSALRIPFLWPLFESKYKIKGNELFEIHGCNMAYWKPDAIKINGYNEEFTGWGPEDKEFVVRLLNNGLHKRFIKLGALVYHIWHPENSKKNLEKNETILNYTKANKITKCKLGLNQYL